MNLNHILKINFSSLKTILWSAFFIRLVAAIFSKGYGMHDDHFLVIEASASWVDGYDYNGWLPWSEGNRGGPEGHSFTYVGLNFLFFYAFKFMGIVNPMLLMFFNRLIHGIISLAVIYFAFKISEKLSNTKNAIIVAWLLAFATVVPFMSVRNLVELAAVPFLMYGSWLLIRENLTNKYNFFYAGLAIGFALSFRYQIAVFAIGIGAYYFFTWKFKEFLWYVAGLILTFVLTQGLVDYIIWGYPFAEFYAYFTYNLDQGMAYQPNSNYFMYFYVLMGVFILPLGILIWIGFLKSYKKYFLFFLPTLIFILFHSIYPNRQERFILTVLPFFIILGIIGFEELKKSLFWDKLWGFSYRIFWILNIPIVVLACFHFSKKSRVEAMYCLYNNSIKSERILSEGSRETKPSQMPKFYANSWNCVFTERVDTSQSLEVNSGSKYDYIFFFGDEDLPQRIEEYKTIYPRLKLVKKCEPSFIDKLIRSINPINSNQYIEVWKTNDPISKE